MNIGRFLRGVRQQRWASVFLDLMVVVVGIFIAIQVGNWNDRRQDREEGFYYLDLLGRQLEQEVEERNEAIARMENVLSDLTKSTALVFYENWSQEDFENFKKWHLAIYSLESENKIPSSLQSLIYRGKIDFLESKTLQEKLFDYNNSYELLIGQSQLTESYHYETVTRLIRTVPYGKKGDLSAIDAEPEDLINNRALKSILRGQVIMHGYQLDSLKSHQEESRQFLRYLQGYLSS